MNEMWLSVVGYEGYYEVSNIGRVKSLDTKMIKSDGRPLTCKGRVLKPWTMNNGYQNVTLAKEGELSKKLIHRLVAYAFLGEVEGKTYINHKDGVKSNNNVDNIEWVTQSENILHAFGTGLKKASNPNKNGKTQGKGNGRTKLTEDDVFFVRANCIKNGGLLTYTEMGRMFDVNSETISKIANKKTWKHLE